MMKEHDKQITIFITGSDTTGKTMLMINLKGWKFFKDYYPTIGFDDYKKVFLYKKYLFHLIVSDVGGEYKMPILAQTCKKNNHIFFVLFNYNNRRTFDFAKSLFDKKNK